MARATVPPRELTVFQAARALRRGGLTASALLESCLERIAAREPEVRAWAALHGEEAGREARRLDRLARQGRWTGPLHGIPLGVKDIIHVQGMQTTAGTRAYRAHLAEEDAACVAALRAAGAILLGKTETTAFAFADPARTRNPWHLARTPGGSSAGSGAAVADRMVPAALGTQTGGSTLRPGAYNGIPAFKPTHGEFPTRGVLELSWTLDHVGVIGRDVADLHLLWRILRAPPASDGAGGPALPRAVGRSRPARLWRLRGHFEERCAPEAVENLDALCRTLRRQGVKIVEQALPPTFEGLYDTWNVVCFSETAVNHQVNFAERRRLYPPRFTERMLKGLAYSAVDYLAAMEHRRRFRAQMLERMAKADALLLPTTPGPPPDPSTTGDASFLSPWTLCGFPAVSLPCGLSGGLPLAVQLVAAPNRDAALLRMARWCEGVLGFAERPR